MAVRVIFARGNYAPPPKVRCCTICRRPFYDPEAHLVARRIEYRKLGPRGRIVKSRVTSYLCVECLDADPDYHLPKLKPFTDAGAARYQMPDVECSDAEFFARYPQRARSAGAK